MLKLNGLEDIRLNKEEMSDLFDKEDWSCLEACDVMIVANTATDKANKRWVQQIDDELRITDKDFGFGVFIRDADWQALKKLLEVKP